MSNDTKTPTTEDLRAELAQAKKREHELALEADALPGRIAEAAREDVKARAQQARETGSVAMAALASEVPELEEQMGTIRYEMWAARLHRAELAARLYGAEEQAAGEKIPVARARLDRAIAGAKRAQEERQAADNAYSGADRLQGEARRKRREADAEVASLEKEYPTNA